MKSDHGKKKNAAANSKQTKAPTAKPSAAPAPTPTAAPQRASAAKTPPGKAPAAKAPAKARLRIPPILLEGDLPAAATQSGPGRRYALSAADAAQPVSPATGELPEAYGTQRLWLTARDPHWLYARWDLTREQLRRYNAQSVDRHLVLRIYRDQIAGQPRAEVHVHPESRNWFVNVAEAGVAYLAELGYYQAGGGWQTIAASGATLAPPDTLSNDTSVWFETLPADLPLRELVRAVKSAVSTHEPLLEALQELRSQGRVDLPAPGPMAAGRWTPEQEQALAQMVHIDAMRRVWMGSLEVTELIRRQLPQALLSAAAAQALQAGAWSGALGEVPGSAVPPVGASVTSPYGRREQRKGFWFNINAELVIYGATEPDAEVAIGGRVIKLRPDGTFGYRFALPDGQYDLPAVATSADHTDSRAASLTFSRRTQFKGRVEHHPQDPGLKTPSPANLD